MRESNLPAPEFRTKSLFTLVLSREKLGKTRVETVGKTRVENRGKTRVEITRIIKESPKVTMREIAAKTGLTPKGVECHIGKMREEDILKRVGLLNLGVGK